MADRIVNAKPPPRPPKPGSGHDDLCTMCYKAIRVEPHKGNYRIISFQNPATSQAIHVFARGAPICVDCLYTRLRPAVSKDKQ